jgi:hypothetical protein
LEPQSAPTGDEALHRKNELLTKVIDNGADAMCYHRCTRVDLVVLSSHPGFGNVNSLDVEGSYESGKRRGGTSWIPFGGYQAEEDAVLDKR